MIDIDASSFHAAVFKLKIKVPIAMKFSQLDIGNEILRLSQVEVPHDKGTLQNSGDVESQGDTVLIGYHTPYAHRLHEHPEYRFQKGRKGKYLTDPIIKNAEVLGIRLGKTFDKELGNG